ncbi:tyrosine-type recombinase/integrase [Streptomyces sp. cg28]|uniref:tyrosine-type recombinase/integrase n=1 Tax=Streptomyces sp. cg28 TaxID=3403457 RepID=UPI003B22746A
MARRSADVYTEWRGGTCRVKWWTGEYRDNGRKRFESQGGFLDEDAAFEYGQKQRADVVRGDFISAKTGAILVSDWAETWYSSLSLSHLSMRNYRSALNAHIKPFFERKSVSDVTILDDRAFKGYLLKNLRKKNSRDLVYSVFSMLMEDAVAAGLRRTSPIERQRRRGRYKKPQRERKREMPIAVVDRLARNAETVFGYSGYVLIWTMAMTGMRPGELFGLTREYCYPSWPASDLRLDPDEEERYADDLLRYGDGEGLMPAIRVERQVQYEEGVLGFHPPKYDSFRTLVIPPFLAGMLRTLQESHASEYVFTAVEGGCLGRVKFSEQYWRPIADGREARKGPRVVRPRDEIPAVPSFKGKRFYLIRHGHKEWLDEDGHQRYVVEARMGHELPGVEGTYSNLTPALERKVVDALQGRWTAFRGTLSGEDAAEVRPRVLNTSVAALVRDAMRRGVVEPHAVVEDVRLVLPEARKPAVWAALSREKKKSPIGG